MTGARGMPKRRSLSHQRQVVLVIA